MICIKSSRGTHGSGLPGESSEVEWGPGEVKHQER
jgi:hypothetical protein